MTVTELQLEAALCDLDRALGERDVDAASAALPRVLSLCADLRGSASPGGDGFAQLRRLADGALAKARELQAQIHERLLAAGNSRKASERYAPSRSAA